MGWSFFAAVMPSNVSGEDEHLQANNRSSRQLNFFWTEAATSCKSLVRRGRWTACHPSLPSWSLTMRLLALSAALAFVLPLPFARAADVEEGFTSLFDG